MPTAGIPMNTPGARPPWVRTVLPCLLCCLSAGAAVPAPATGSPLYQLEASGIQELRTGDYAGALTRILADTGYSDTAFREFKLGIVYCGLGRLGDGIGALKRSAALSPLLAPCAYERIGDLTLGQGRGANALVPLRVALECDIPPAYSEYLREKITGIIVEHNLDTTDRTWLQPWFAARRRSMSSYHTALIDTLVRAAAWKQLDSQVQQSLGQLPGDQASGLVSHLQACAVPAIALSARTAYQISWGYFNRGLPREARQWLKRTESIPGYVHAVTEKKYWYLKGMLLYRLGEYRESLEWLVKYDNKYGPWSEVLISIARAYRNIKRMEKARETYDRFISLFPGHQLTQDIIWSRAWDLEAGKEFEAAIGQYDKIISKYNSGNRTDEARFRKGLVWYKQDEWEKACVEWERFLAQRPSSALVSDVHYWIGKCRLAQRKEAEARSGFLKSIVTSPAGYYAFRSREALSVLGDTVQPPLFDPASDLRSSQAWLDSISTRRLALSPRDSAWYRTGSLLAACGLMSHARFYLSHLERNFPDNLPLQFELATLYMAGSDPTSAYRIARQFAWKIPPERRAAMPFDVYDAMYPSAFGAYVETEAEKHGVDPNLVHAVMRQESVFDPAIVSPAGAIGLMQIMPETGKTIASKLATPFASDSLYNPAYNIAFGAYYLGELLDDFEGNIILAVASYNGGPHNAKKWYHERKHENVDLFVENIPFTETRKYVKKVLGNYWTYTRVSKFSGGSARSLARYLSSY